MSRSDSSMRFSLASTMCSHRGRRLAGTAADSLYASVRGGAAIADCVRFGTIAALMSVRSVVWIRFRLIAPTSARFQHGIGRILSGKLRDAHSIVDSNRTCQQTTDQEHQFPIIQPLFLLLSPFSPPRRHPPPGFFLGDAGDRCGVV